MSNEHFILTFTDSGEPRLERVEFDSKTNRYMHKPIPRESETAARALASPAGKWYTIIRDARRLAVA